MTVGYGVIGLGFIGARHVLAVQSARAAGVPCRLVAVGDRSADRLCGRVSPEGSPDAAPGDALFDPREVRGYVDPRQLIDDPRVDALSICTHTDTHVDLAVAALRAGKHVLVEKPVALSSAEVRRLAAAAHEAGRLCMPAMCMRFWPGWSWLKDRIIDGSLGAVQSATFQRLGSPPAWGTQFYRDLSRSGGSLFDLHIHDVDFLRWCFGPPREVTSTGTTMHVSTIYRYENGPAHVLAEGGQDYAPGYGFTMRYAVAFRDATADFDLSRSHPLELSRDGRREAVEIPALSAYDAEVRHFIGAVAAGTGNGELAATIDEAAAVTEILEAERRSLETGRPIQLR